jgi:lantibiotic modifying enzyme
MTRMRRTALAGLLLIAAAVASSPSRPQARAGDRKLALAVASSRGQAGTVGHRRPQAGGFAAPSSADRPYVSAARDAARWIETSAVRSDRGTCWPADPKNPKSVRTDLYSGSAGVVLFYAELYRATGDEHYAREARAGADYLMSALDAEKQTGLYEGIAGIGFSLGEAWRATHEEKYRAGLAQAADLLRRRARKAGRGVEWNEMTDIIAGSAGTGLFLLYAARELNDPPLRSLSAEAGARLIELGLPEKNGTKWAMDPKFPRFMPNFSHGTAGVAYFLATIFQETGRPEFKAAALAGGHYLQSIAFTDGDICLIRHHEPQTDGEKLYYLSWCHGPVGTARLFYRLYQITNDRSWMEWVQRAARAVTTSGIPGRQTPGFWNNVSQCCGSAGVAEFFLQLHRITGNMEYRTFAERMLAQIVARGERDQSGLRWVQAESRTEPDNLVAQTGYMQGAAGLGMLLLDADEYERGHVPAITFPDSPF